jgi:L-idonate 5-dehydrogenase
LTVGDHVAVNPSRRCGFCPRCREGRSNLCENVFFMGSASRNPHMQGGFSTFFDTTPGQCVVVPNTVPLSAVAMAEPLAVCLHAVARAGNLSGKNIAIFGGGPIGLLTLLAARIAGIADATMIDLADMPLALARSLGASQTFNTSAGADSPIAAAAGAPFDVVFEVTGAPSALALAIRTAAARRHGRPGRHLPGGDVSLPANLIMTRNSTIGARCVSTTNSTRRSS